MTFLFVGTTIITSLATSSAILATFSNIGISGSSNCGAGGTYIYTASSSVTLSVQAISSIAQTSCNTAYTNGQYIQAVRIA